MISFDVDNNKFNFRTSGIFLDESGKRFLTNTREKTISFCVLPGGRVEMGEDTEQTLKREIQEELGTDIEIVCLKAVAENFFVFDNKNYHELQYVYFAKLKNKEIEKYTAKFFGTETEDFFEWKSIEDIDNINYKPACLKEIIKEVSAGNLTLKHIIHKGNG